MIIMFLIIQIDRATAYETTSGDISKWDPIVRKNRKVGRFSSDFSSIIYTSCLAHRKTEISHLLVLRIKY